MQPYSSQPYSSQHSSKACRSSVVIQHSFAGFDYTATIHLSNSRSCRLLLCCWTKVSQTVLTTNWQKAGAKFVFPFLIIEIHVCPFTHSITERLVIGGGHRIKQLASKVELNSLLARCSCCYIRSRLADTIAALDAKCGWMREALECWLCQ